MDPTLLTVAVLTSIPGQAAMITAIVEVLKNAIFWSDNEWRDRFTPILSAIVGVCYGTVCAHLTHADVAVGGVIGFGMGLGAAGLYPRAVGPVVGKVKDVLNPSKEPK